MLLQYSITKNAYCWLIKEKYLPIQHRNIALDIVWGTNFYG